MILSLLEIDGRLTTDKEEAGKAILDVCTKMTGSDAVAMGKYRGFSLVLAYNGASNEYRMTMNGTLSHTVVPGADVCGNACDFCGRCTELEPGCTGPEQDCDHRCPVCDGCMYDNKAEKDGD